MLERRMVSRDDFRRFSVFNDLADELLDELRQNAWTKLITAEEVLFRQNDHVRRSYFCLAGQLKLFRFTRTGSEKIFHLASAGDELCDSLSLRPERSYPLNCTAIVASEVLSVDSEVVSSVFHRSRGARTSLVDSLMKEVDGLIDHIELLSVDKATFRVASFLLNEYRRNGNKRSFHLNSSKKYIASYLSLQPETLSRCLRSFREKGIACSTNRRIDILDPERLAEMVIGLEVAA